MKYNITCLFVPTSHLFFSVQDILRFDWERNTENSRLLRYVLSKDKCSSASYIPKYNLDVVVNVKYRWYFETYDLLCFQVGHAQVQLMPR